MDTQAGAYVYIAERIGNTSVPPFNETVICTVHLAKGASEVNVSPSEISLCKKNKTKNLRLVVKCKLAPFTKPSQRYNNFSVIYKTVFVKG